MLFQKDRGQPVRSPATADPAESETAIEVDLADLADPKYYLLPHLSGLEHPGSAPALNGERPPHAGQPWTRDEDERLALRHLAGIPVKDLAVEFRRTRGAIRSRLIRQGLIAPG